MAQLSVLPDGLIVQTAEGNPLVRALWQAGISLETPCGGFGVCGKCLVRLQGEHVAPPTPEERKHLSPEQLAEGWRLGCRHQITGDLVVWIPDGSRPSIAQVLTSAVERQVPLQPAVRRLQVELPYPTPQDERADLSRLLEALDNQYRISLPPSSVALPVLQQLPDALRSLDFRPWLVVWHDQPPKSPWRLLSVHSKPPSPLLGIAFDIGTTTLVGYLIDLEGGREIAHAARLNPQVQYGDDVVARLSYAYHQTGGLKQLQHAVVRGLNEIISEACHTAGVPTENIYEVVVAGNTTMLHLLLGVNTNPIAVAPYVPVFSQMYTVEARQVGLRVNPSAVLTTLPCVAGYVGADTVAVALTHLSEADGETVMAIDIGTNGEVVLRHAGSYYCASAAAGPAFEGGRIFQGIRAERGAISQVRVEGNNGNRWLHVATIGGAPAKGICGSGLIDAVACLLDIGAIDEAGRIRSPRDEVWWQAHITTLCEQRAFRLVAPDAADNPEGILLTQRDIRELQLAKGSIRAVMEVLLHEAGIGWQQVQRLLVAGAFGMYVNLYSAQRIGLLPPIPLERIEQVGNAAGAGAKLALRSVRERQRARQLAQQMKHVVMTGNIDYQEAYIDYLAFGGT